MAKRVFFSFHYQDVKDFRANVVRNHWLTKKDRAAAGFFDASIWETAKRTSDLALKKLINKGIQNTSSSCVLIGSGTYKRRWVRYEIFRSVFVDNSICALHINKIKDRFGNIKNYGENPLDYVGLEFSHDGFYAQPIEYKISKWGNNNDFPRYKLKHRTPLANRGKAFKMSKWHSTYKWYKDDGYSNFSKWI